MRGWCRTHVLPVSCQQEGEGGGVGGLDWEDSAGISAPLYDIVDVVFELGSRGFFRRQVGLSRGLVLVQRLMLHRLRGGERRRRQPRSGHVLSITAVELADAVLRAAASHE
jgi:hypothetical protein